VFAALSPARRRLVLGVLAVAVAALSAVAVLAIVTATAGRDRAAAVPQDRPGPVLLVPGYGGSTTGLQTLARRLRASGKQVEILPLPGGGTGDLTVQATTLGSAARAVLARTGAPSVDVVGYSAGGVVARLWVHDYGGAGIVRRVVTLGSPQHGTQLATLGQSLGVSCPTACQQLAAGSDLLAGLNARAEGSSPSFVSIWTTADEVVVPPESAQLDGALNLTVQSVCAASRVQHSGLPTDPTIARIVLAELAPGPPTALTPADCARFSS
jgi:triacylglycerol lipase